MASNTQGITVNFKLAILEALHNFGTTVVRTGTGSDTFKAALYYQNSSVTPTTATAYSATNEVSGTGYTAGGVVISNSTPPQLNGTTAYWTPSSNIQWTGLTISSAFDCLLIYNNTLGTQNSVAVLTFPAQTIASGTFTVTMPSNTSTSALLQVN